MKKNRELEQQILDEANFMVENNSTVRETAQVFGVSKTTVHVHMTEKLPNIDFTLHKKVAKVLATNKAERQVRGGLSKWGKYKKRI